MNSKQFALIAHIAPGVGTPDGYVLAWEGDGVAAEITECGRHTDDLGCAPPYPECHGLYVFEGEMRYWNEFEWGGEMDWYGLWRPASHEDITRFHLLHPLYR